MRKKNKVLFTATVDSHIKNFHLPYLKYFKDLGYEVHVATNGDDDIPYCDKKIKIPFERNPFNLNNLKAIKILKNILLKEQYDIIHTHTPMGSVVTRIAAIKARRKYGTRIIYTAHGFHFYNGASKKNWLLYYPVEKILSKYTDTLITINNEDFNLARSKFYCKDVQYVPGVGIDNTKFCNKLSINKKNEIRSNLGISKDDIVLIYVARLDKNKNQKFLIEVMKDLVSENPHYHLLLVGPDEFEGKYQEMAKNIKNIHFLGLRNDIPELLSISNIAVSSSIREGLPVNIMEAMSMNLPVVATDARGVRDLIKNNFNGFVVEPNDKNGFIQAINNINSVVLNQDTVEYSNTYRISSILNKMKKIYHVEYPKLSIVIPVYNLENCLNDTLNSVINQNVDFNNIEVIIIDDGSTDGSKKICLEYEKKYTFLKYYYEENGGVSKARNKGLSLATGDYIYFIDGDDILLPDSLQNVMNNLNHGYDIILSDFIQFYDITKLKKIKKRNNNLICKVNKSAYPDNLKLLFKYNLYNLSLCTNIISNKIIKNKKLDTKLKYTEDMDFLLSSLLSSKEIYIMPEVIYGYRKNRNDSATKKISKKRIEDLLFFIEKWEEKLSNVDENYKEYIMSFISYQYLIALGINKLYDNSIEFEKKLYSKKYLLKYNHLFKVKIANFIYKIFGYNTLVNFMGKYLSLKK